MRAASPFTGVDCSVWRLDVEREVGPMMVGVSGGVCVKSPCSAGDDVAREDGLLVVASC